MKKFFLVFIALLGLNIFLNHATAEEMCQNSTTNQCADTIYFNGKVATINEKNEIVNGFAVKDGIIIGVEKSSKALNKYKSNNTQMVDLKNQFVLPGFFDAHVHFSMSVNISPDYNLILTSSNTVDSYLKAIQTYVKNNPNKTQYLGMGWSNTVFEKEKIEPNKEMLDKISKDKPIFLLSEDAHSAWVNSTALKIAGINKNTISPAGSEIVKDKNGEPTGRLNELSAIFLVREKLEDYKQEEYEKSMLAFQENVYSLGTTSIFDPMLNERTIKIIKEMANKNQLNLRVFGAYQTDALAPLSQFDKFGEMSKTDKVENKFYMNSVKIFVDGVIESKTALLVEPYASGANMGNNYYGIAVWNKDKLFEAVALANKNGLKAHMHVIGDESTKLGLDAVKYSKEQNKNMKINNTMAHLQLVKPEDFKEFKKLNINVLVGPIWVVKNDSFYTIQETYLGKERANTEYPINSFIKAGANVAIHSDYPVNPVPQPMLGVEMGITRKLPDEYATGTNLPLGIKESTTLTNMLRLYTINGAKANDVEQKLGSIENNKFADFVILSCNPYNVKTENIHKITVVETYIDGKRVFEAKNKNECNL